MKVWKVILAALVIFAAGVVTGGLLVQSAMDPANSASTGSVPSMPARLRGEALDRLQRQLYLTPDQRQRIESVLRESNVRMRQLWETIAPQAQEEHRRVNDLIRAELNPEQRTKFDEMVKSRSLNRSLDRRHDQRRELRSPRRTNAPAKAEKERPAESEVQ